MYVKGKIYKKEDLEGNVIVKAKENSIILFENQVKSQIVSYLQASVFFGFIYNLILDDISNIQTEKFIQFIFHIMTVILLWQLLRIFFNPYENKLSQIIGALSGFIFGYVLLFGCVHELLKFELAALYKFCGAFCLVYIAICLLVWLEESNEDFLVTVDVQKRCKEIMNKQLEEKTCTGQKQKEE